MFPPILLQNLRGVLDFFALIIRWITLKRRRISNEQFLDIFQIICNYTHMAILWIELLNLVQKFGTVRRKKRLLKLHLLLPFLGGYRLIYY